MLSLWRVVIGFAITLFPCGSALAQDVDTSIFADNQEKTYDNCLTAAESDAEAALDMAIRWAGLGGGDPARHCRALSLRNLGDFEEAGRLLEQLAKNPTASAPVKAGLWHQAGQVYSDSGAYTQALSALDRAIQFAPDRHEFYLDRAITKAGLKTYWEAIDDLNTFMDAEPGNAVALSLRGSAYRHLELFDLAQDDIERSLALNAEDPDTWLERGLLAEAQEENTDASMAWIKVLQLAPDSVAADIARARIEKSALQQDTIQAD